MTKTVEGVGGGGAGRFAAGGPSVLLKPFLESQEGDVAF